MKTNNLSVAAVLLLALNALLLWRLQPPMPNLKQRALAANEERAVMIAYQGDVQAIKEVEALYAHSLKPETPALLIDQLHELKMLNALLKREIELAALRRDAK